MTADRWREFAQFVSDTSNDPHLVREAERLLAEAAQGAAPLDKPCKVCEGWGAYCDEHKPKRVAPRPHRHERDDHIGGYCLEGAAPRAEGLDVEAVLYAAESNHERDWNADHQGGHTERDWRKCNKWPCSSLARLSRPSDERVPGASDDR